MVGRKRVHGARDGWGKESTRNKGWLGGREYKELEMGDGGGGIQGAREG